MTRYPTLDVDHVVMVRFLLARIEEDDGALRSDLRAARRKRTVPAADLTSLSKQLADCEAKRQIIAEIQLLLALRDLPAEKPVRSSALAALRALTLPYECHPSYRSEWRIKS